MTRILIPCGGTQERWNGPGIKELVDIEGEPLLLRTIRQVRKRGVDDIVLITNKPEIRHLVRDCRIVWPPIHDCLCQSLYHSEELSEPWDRTHILLGDVVFSEFLLDRIFESEEITHLFGLDFELFSLSFSRRGHERVTDSLFKAIVWREIGVGRGKLWDWYRVYNNLPMVADYEHDWGASPILTKLQNDWSQDFDRYDIYLKFLEEGEFNVRT